MKVTRIFVSYEAVDKAFAMQLMNDLRDAGLEVVTDRTDLDDTAFEQFLAQELPQCQHLIVVQTPAALQSSRVQAIADTALKHVQVGQMIGVLCMIAPSLNTVEAPVVPSTWSTIPTFDASQDYLRALAGLSLHLGLPRPSPKAPPPGPRNMQKVTRSFNLQNRQKVAPLPDPQSMQKVAPPPDPQNGQQKFVLPPGLQSYRQHRTRPLFSISLTLNGLVHRRVLIVRGQGTGLPFMVGLTLSSSVLGTVPCVPSSIRISGRVYV